jgi:hypothetical protein
MQKGKIMSEVARLLRQIELEYEAAKRGLKGYATVSKHEFITARYDQAGMYQEELAEVIGEKQASDLVCNLYIEVFEGKKAECNT